MSEVCSCGEIKALLEEVLGKAKVPAKRGGRAPNKYNLHMKSCIPTKTGAIKDRFKECANDYTASKKDV